MSKLFLTTGQMLIVDVYNNKTKEKKIRKLLITSVDKDCMEVISVFDIEAQKNTAYFLDELSNNDFVKQLCSGSPLTRVSEHFMFTYSLFT